MNYKYKKIVYFPPFKNETDLNDHIATASWYLSCLEPEQICFLVDVPVNYMFEIPMYYDADIIHSYNKNKDKIKLIDIRNSTSIENMLDSSDIIMNWNEDVAVDDNWKELLKQQRKKNKQIWNVDKYRQRFHGSYYIKAGFEKGNYPEIDDVISENKKRFKTLIKNFSDNETANLFLTGPMSSYYKEYDCKDGLTIICNSVIFDDELLEEIDPKIICIADPIFHFGVSRYAATFRKKLQDVAEKYGLWIIVPFNYYRLFTYHFPLLKSQTIGIPFDYDKSRNLDISQNFYLNPYKNILTILMLPLATTLANNINVIGADGRKYSDDNYFWSFNPRTQINDKMDNIKEAHPAFFNIDYNEYYYEHINYLSEHIQEAEKIGKSVRSLSPSLIPCLRERYACTGKDYEQEYYPLVSIVMPCHNNGDTIEESINSILQQDYKNFEIIVVDEGSDANTQEILTAIENLDERIRIYYKVKKCAAAGRNYGILKATGKYIGFLDSDDIFYPSSLKFRMDALILNDYDAVYCTTQLLDEELNRLNTTMTIKRDFASFLDFKNSIFHISSLIIKKHIVEQHMFDEAPEYYAVEDLDLYQRIARTGVLFFNVPDAETGYIQNTKGAVFSGYKEHSDRVNMLWDSMYEEDRRVNAPIQEFRYGIGDAERLSRNTKKNLQTIIWLALKGETVSVKEMSAEISSNIIRFISPLELINMLRYIISRYYRVPIEKWEEYYLLNQTKLNKVLFKNPSFKFSFNPYLHPHLCKVTIASDNNKKEMTGRGMNGNVSTNLKQVNFNSQDGLSTKPVNYSDTPDYSSAIRKMFYFMKISKKFDGLQYVRTYPDVLSAVVEGKIKSAFDHFVENGFKEKRKIILSDGKGIKGTLDDITAKFFDGLSYVDHYPDVREHILNDFMRSAREHYMKMGRKEGRKLFISLEKTVCAGTSTDIWERKINDIVTNLSEYMESEYESISKQISDLENFVDELHERQSD